MNSLRILSDWPWPIGFSIAILLALAAWWLYRRETRSLSTRNRWLLPLLRSAAIFLLTLTFLEPVIHHRTKEGDPGTITFLIDGSQSMSILDDPKANNDERKSRFDRATNLLLRNEQLSIEKLSEEFELRVRRLDDGHTSTLWESSEEQASTVPESISAWTPTSLASTSAIGDAIADTQQALAESPQENREGSHSSVLVLLSDGQNNTGPSPLEVASQVSSVSPIFAVGFGATAEAIDLAIQSIECPPRVFRTDTLRGTLQLKDRVGVGKSMLVSLMVAGEVVWQRRLSSENSASRRVEFSMPTAPLYELVQKQMPPNAKYAVLPLPITAKVTSDVAESNIENNLQMVNIAIAAQRSRLLLLDGRSRWENRYLRNMFDRDPAWQVESQIATEPTEFHFPKSRDELFQYDLVVLGDVAGKMLTRDQMGWLREFVEFNGGGLILISGARRLLAEPEYSDLQKLFPVSWPRLDSGKAAALQRLPKRVQLTTVGQSLAALRIDPRGEIESRGMWDQLPALQYVEKVEVLPGQKCSRWRFLKLKHNHCW